MNQHITLYRTSPTLKGLTRPDSIWQQQWFAEQKHVCVTYYTQFWHNKHNILSFPTSQTHKIYKRLNDSFGVQVNTLK